MGSHKAAYEFYKSMDPVELSKLKPEQIAMRMQQQLKPGEGADVLANHTTFGVTFLIAVKVAKVATEEEFEEFLNTGDTPPMKLTNQEMTVLRGGKGQKPKTYTGPGISFKDPETNKKFQDVLYGGLTPKTYKK